MTRRVPSQPPEARRPRLQVPRDDARTRIQVRIDAGKELLQRNVRTEQELTGARADERKWSAYNAELLRQIVDTDDLVKDYFPTAGRVFFGEPSFGELLEAHRENVQGSMERLESIRDRLELIPESTAATAPARDASSESIARVRRLCERFHLVSKQLRVRHDGRSTIEIEDEYDVQDVIRALLALDFDDVRTEEWTPSYAGGASRMDFLLKSTGIVVEVKKTRRGLGPKELGDQLLIDIARYQTHPDCSTLVCFVYDPEGRVGNPAGLEVDLSKQHGRIRVFAIIAPKGL